MGDDGAVGGEVVRDRVELNVVRERHGSVIWARNAVFSFVSLAECSSKGDSHDW